MNTDSLEQFRTFVALAGQLARRHMTAREADPPARTAPKDAAPPLVDAFRTFVHRARLLLAVTAPSAGSPRPSSPNVDARISSPVELPRATIERFTSFVGRARPLALKDARLTLDALSSLAPRVVPWVVVPSVLGIAGVGLLELSFTRLLAWALSPPGHPALALACQGVLLSRLGLDPPSEPLAVEAQCITDDGIPDLVLRGPRHLVVIEAKTGTGEHAAPSGLPQTIAYARQLLEPSSHAVKALVFLTLDGDEASNSEALRCTWLEVSLCLVEALRSTEMEAGVRAVYASILSHWLVAATPQRIDVLAVLRRAHELQQASDVKVLAEFEAIRQWSKILPGRMRA